jgi:hypothetical protein
MNHTSFNNRFILEPYKTDGTVKATTGSGFALISQKVSLKPLKLVLDFEGWINGHEIFIPKGSLAYVREELLHTQEWAKKIMEGEGIEGKFIIVDSSFVESVKIE